MRIQAVLAVLLLCHSLLGQYATKVETPYALTGIVNPQILGDLILCDRTSVPTVASIAIVQVDSGTAQVSCRAVDQQGKLTPVKRLDAPQGKTYFAIDKPGTHTVLLLIIDFDKKIFVEEQLEVTVGPPTPPPPPTPPQPDIPPDKFDNLGQRVDLAADAANLPPNERAAMSAVYSAVAARVESRAILRASDAIAEIQLKWVEVGATGVGWMSVRKLISDDGAKRSLPLYEFDDYFRAVAVGLKGGAT